MIKWRKAKLHCCERCQVYWSCDTKWYRGERHEEDICCPRCNFYSESLAKLSKKHRDRMIEINKDLGQK